MNTEDFLVECNRTPILKNHCRKNGDVNLEMLRTIGFVRDYYEIRDLEALKERLDPEGFDFNKKYLDAQLPSGLTDVDKNEKFDLALVNLSIRPDFQRDIFEFRRRLGIPPVNGLNKFFDDYSSLTMSRLSAFAGMYMNRPSDDQIEKDISEEGYTRTLEFVILDYCLHEYEAYPRGSRDPDREPKPIFDGREILDAVQWFEKNMKKFAKEDAEKWRETFCLYVGSIISQGIAQLIRKYELSLVFKEPLLDFIAFKVIGRPTHGRIKLADRRFVDRKLTGVTIDVDPSISPRQLADWWREYLVHEARDMDRVPLHKRRLTSWDLLNQEFSNIRKRTQTDKEAYESLAQIKGTTAEAIKKRLQRAK
ncbi:hypothetical protein HY524_00365 [Candidatus Berkelbacteria bacterium]|nr:hypothetical protein [Candidatus Berkelbacteria bacterium]